MCQVHQRHHTLMVPTCLDIGYINSKYFFLLDITKSQLKHANLHTQADPRCPPFKCALITDLQINMEYW